MRLSSHSTRGVSLIEGMIATMVLLVGMVGVLQGLAIASAQNSIANRHTRASIIAQQLATAIEQQGRARLLATSGLFATGQCASTVPGAIAPYIGDLAPLPPSLSAQGFTAAGTCYVDFDALGAAYRDMTPGYGTQDDATYRRVVVVFQHPTVPDIIYVGVNVGWRDAGQVRIVKRFTAVYDTTTNQTNLEF